LYSWQKQFFENGAAAFGSDERSERRREEQRCQQVEEMRKRKSDIFSELMAEHIKLTSEYGGALDGGGFRSYTPDAVIDD